MNSGTRLNIGHHLTRSWTPTHRTRSWTTSAKPRPTTWRPPTREFDGDYSEEEIRHAHPLPERGGELRGMLELEVERWRLSLPSTLHFPQRGQRHQPRPDRQGVLVHIEVRVVLGVVGALGGVCRCPGAEAGRHHLAVVGEVLGPMRRSMVTTRSLPR